MRQVWTRAAGGGARTGDGAVVARFDGVGHPSLRASHPKTFEISADREVGAGATCVVAVGAAADAPGPGLAGALEIALTAGDVEVRVRAWANPGWRPGAAAVVRRSGVRRPGTLATDADTTAVDLPRAFADRIADPSQPVTVVVRRRSAASVVLMRWPEVGADRLRAELDAADAVVTEDAGAVRPLDDRWTAAAELPAGDVRVLVLATGGLPGATTPALLRSGNRVEVAGLPPELAVAARSPVRGPLRLDPGAGLRRPADVEGLLRGVPASTAVVLACDGAVAAAIAARSGRAHVALLGAGPWAWWGRADQMPVRRGDVTLCLDRTLRPTAAHAEVDPALLAAARSLRTDGVPTKTVAAALSAATGLSRSRAYDIVAALDC